jgi:hypothetical protein
MGGLNGATAQKFTELQELETLLAGRPSAMSYLEDAPPNFNQTSGRTRCSTR